MKILLIGYGRMGRLIEQTALAAGDQTIPCPCGKSQLEFHQQGEHCQVTVPCLFCAKDHHTVCSTRAMMEEKLLVLSCSASGLGCCFIGEEEAVFGEMEKLERAVDKLRMDDQEETRGHLGLYNVDTILRKHYGAQFGLCLENRPDGTGTMVTATLPLRYKEDASSC